MDVNDPLKNGLKLRYVEIKFNPNYKLQVSFAKMIRCSGNIILEINCIYTFKVQNWFYFEIFLYSEMDF